MRGLCALLGVVPLQLAGRALSQPALPTLRPGVLRIGTYFVNPPFEFISNGERVGFEVDLMRAVARTLGLEARFEDTRWEIILSEMREERYDCIIGGITITPERQRQLAWSAPYMTTTLSLVVAAAQSPARTTMADLRYATVGVQAATTDYDAAIGMQRAGQIADVKVYPFAQIAEAVTDLLAGRIQALMKVEPVAAWFVRRTPGLRILAQVPDNPQPLGIGFSPGNPGLRAAVDRAVEELKRDGTLGVLATRWDIG